MHLVVQMKIYLLKQSRYSKIGPQYYLLCEVDSYLLAICMIIFKALTSKSTHRKNKQTFSEHLLGTRHI